MACACSICSVTITVTSQSEEEELHAWQDHVTNRRKKAREGKKAQRQQEPKEHAKEKTQPDSTDQQHATSHNDPYVYTTRTPAAPSRHIATTHTSQNHKVTHSTRILNANTAGST
jgi:hypothetical protein